MLRLRWKWKEKIGSSCGLIVDDMVVRERKSEKLCCRVAHNVTRNKHPLQQLNTITE